MLHLPARTARVRPPEGKPQSGVRTGQQTRPGFGAPRPGSRQPAAKRSRLLAGGNRAADGSPTGCGPRSNRPTALPLRHSLWEQRLAARHPPRAQKTPGRHQADPGGLINLPTKGSRLRRRHPPRDQELLPPTVPPLTRHAHRPAMPSPRPTRLRPRPLTPPWMEADGFCEWTRTGRCRPSAPGRPWSFQSF